MLSTFSKMTCSYESYYFSFFFLILFRKDRACFQTARALRACRILSSEDTATCDGQRERFGEPSGEGSGRGWGEGPARLCVARRCPDGPKACVQRTQWPDPPNTEDAQASFRSPDKRTRSPSDEKAQSRTSPSNLRMKREEEPQSQP